jgi:hypothetical protein
LYQKSRLVVFLGWLSLITLFFSFGRHFDALTTFLLNYLPGYNKFRVPATILVLLQFAIVVLAGYGIKFTLSPQAGKSFLFKNLKKIFMGFIVVFILFAMFNSVFEQLGFLKEGDAQRYSPEQLNQLKQERFDKFVNDGYMALLFFIAALGTLYLWALKKIPKHVFLIIIALLTMFDLYQVNKRFLQNLTHHTNLEREFKTSKLDQFLLNDTNEMFRIYPLAGDFGLNKWAYHHQIIGGYHGAKLQRYQDIIDHCLNAEIDGQAPINWNIVNMLNVKYLIFNQSIPLPNLEFAYNDKTIEKAALKSRDFLPRAWFVKDVEKITKKEEIWQTLNSRKFNPAEIAIVEKDIPPIASPMKTEVTFSHYDLDSIKIKVQTDTTSFLVVSEIFYPAGWKAFIDGEESEIYATNYILRGLVIPTGEHEIEFIFEPKSFALGILLSWIGISITFLSILIGAILFFLQRRNIKHES